MSGGSINGDRREGGNIRKAERVGKREDGI